jgi:hypothetical protein
MSIAGTAVVELPRDEPRLDGGMPKTERLSALGVENQTTLEF